MERLSGLEMGLLFNTEKDAIKVAKQMDLFVNSFSIQAKQFEDSLLSLSRSVQNKFTRICWTWIKNMNDNYLRNSYDERNKQASIYSNRIYNLLKGKLPAYEIESFESQFVKELIRTHRTLQQSFTEIVLDWIIIKANQGNRDAIKVVKNLPERFNSLPFI